MDQTRARSLVKHKMGIGRLPKTYLFIAAALSALLLSAMSLLMFSGSAQAEPTLEFLNTPPLKLTLANKQDGDKTCNAKTGEYESVPSGESAPDLKTTKATVWVRYTDSPDTLENLRFSARAEANSTGDTSSAWKDVSVCWERVSGEQGNTIEARAVEPFVIFIEVGSPPERNLPRWDGIWNLISNMGEYLEWARSPGLPYEWSSLSGYLLVTAKAPGADAVPGTLALQLISPANGYKTWFLRILTWVPGLWFLLTFVVGLVIALSWTAVRKNLLSKLDFDIKGGWASNLTTAGSVLGVIVSSGLLPEDTFFMAKAQYIALNVIFALVLLLAYLLFRLFPYGVTLLVAGALILAAAAGELATVCFLLYEISFRGILTPEVVPYLQGTLIVTAFLVTWVAGKKALETIKTGKPLAEDKAVVHRFYKAWSDENMAEFEKILAPYYVYSDPKQGRQNVDRLKQKVRDSHNTFSTIRFDIENRFAGEGKVSSQITMHAEYTDGAKGKSDASRKISVKFLDICRVAGGIIEEQWGKLPPEP